MRGIQFQYNVNQKIYWKKTIVLVFVFFFILFSLFPLWDQGIKKAETNQTLDSENSSNQTSIPKNFSATVLNRFQIRLDWTYDESIDWTWIEYAEISDDAWSRGDHQNLTNTTNNQFTHHNLEPNSTYFYKAWSWNNTLKAWSEGVTTNATTQQNTPSIISLLNPSVDSLQNLDPVVQWIVKVDDSDMDTIHWSIECSNNQSLHCTSPSGTTKCLTLQHLNYSSSYHVWINATDHYDTVKEEYDFSVRDIYRPTKPDSIIAETISSTEIELCWNNGLWSDETYIERNNVSEWEQGNGTAVYKDEDTVYLCPNLNPHTTYYFQAWSWNETDDAYSDEFITCHNKTLNTLPEFGIPTPIDQSTNQLLALTWMINIHDKDLDSLNWSIECSNGQSNSDVNDRSGIKSVELENLGFNQEYTVLVTATDGLGTVQNEYSFSTKSENELPEIEEVYPRNNSEISLNDLKNITVNIYDLENDTFYWSIITSPSIGNASNTSTDEIINCPVSNLDINQEYTWNLSIQDLTSFHWKNQSYCFTVINESENKESEFNPGDLVADAGGPYEGIAKTAIEFDGFQSTSTSNITGYRWDFDNDGTWDTEWSEQSTATHTYDSSGEYVIRMEITDNESTASDIAEVIIVQYNNPPTISVTGDVSYTSLIDEPWTATVRTNDLDEDQVRYKIKWAENEEEDWSSYQDSGTETELTHQWSTIGTKTVKIMVEDSNHAMSKWYTVSVVSVYKYDLSEAEKGLDGLFTKTTGDSNQNIYFHAYDDGFIPLGMEVVSVSWNFGDNTTGDGIQVNHSYTKGGTYTITCVSITDDNQVLSMDHEITIASEASIGSVIGSLPFMQILFFVVILALLIMVYFVMIKKQIPLRQIPGFILQQIKKIKLVLTVIKKKKEEGLKLKSTPSTTDSFLGENLDHAWKESMKDTSNSYGADWNSEVYKPMTFKGTYCEIMGKKIQEQKIQNQLDKLHSEMTSFTSESKEITGQRTKDNDTYDQSLEYKNN